MTDAKKRSGAAKLSKLLLPFFLLAGLTLFFLFGGHELLSFSQLAENYTSVKAFVDGQLATALLVFGAAYPISCLITPRCFIANTCRRGLVRLDSGGCGHLRGNHWSDNCLYCGPNGT